MKKKNKLYICFLAVAICFYVVALVNFTAKDTSTAVVFLCVGSALFCTSSAWHNKDGNDK